MDGLRPTFQTAKRIPVDHPEVEQLKAAAMDCWRSRDLAGLRSACSAAVTVIANLPPGRYDWDEALDRAVEKKTAAVRPIR